MKQPRRKPDPNVMNRREALRCVPVKNREVREVYLESGDIVLEYPLVTRPWIERLTRRFRPREVEPTRRRLQLDELGTKTWLLMDDRRTVGDISRTFAETFQLHPKEAELAVSRFLRELGRRGIVGLR